jgi:hypothetical protein
VADHVVAVEDLDIVVDLDVGSGDHARALLGQGQGGAVAGVHADGHVLEVQQDFEHVLLQAFDRGVLMQHAVDLDFRDGEARDGRQQHATQGIAQRMPVTPLQRFDNDLCTGVGKAFDLRTARTQNLVGGNRHVAGSPSEPPAVAGGSPM